MTVSVDGRESLELMLDENLIDQAKVRGIDLNRAAENGIAEAVRRADVWREENRAAIEGWNAYVEHNGLPLAGYRLF